MKINDAACELLKIITIRGLPDPVIFFSTYQIFIIFSHIIDIGFIHLLAKYSKSKSKSNKCLFIVDKNTTKTLVTHILKDKPHKIGCGDIK